MDRIFLRYVTGSGTLLKITNIAESIRAQTRQRMELPEPGEHSPEKNALCEILQGAFVVIG